jgi:hypothetical protein
MRLLATIGQGGYRWTSADKLQSSPGSRIETCKGPVTGLPHRLLQTELMYSWHGAAHYTSVQILSAPIDGAPGNICVLEQTQAHTYIAVTIKGIKRLPQGTYHNH